MSSDINYNTEPIESKYKAKYDSTSFELAGYKMHSRSYTSWLCETAEIKNRVIQEMVDECEKWRDHHTNEEKKAYWNDLADYYRKMIETYAK